MRRHKTNRRAALATAIGTAIALMTPLAHADLTGNIGVVSKYILRGISHPASGTAESDTPAVQGGFDWSDKSGIYAGYWGSNLDYTMTTPGKVSKSTTGVENDLYVGYKPKVGPVTLNVGAIYYYYLNMDEGNAAELVGAASMGPVTLGVKYLTQDVFWGNAGDQYWTVDYSTPLPSDYTFATTLGYYVYDKSDGGDPATNLKLAAGTTTKSSAFRHLSLSISHPIANKAATMSVTYIVGGDDRHGQKQGDQIVLGLSTTF